MATPDFETRRKMAVMSAEILKDDAASARTDKMIHGQRNSSATPEPFGNARTLRGFRNVMPLPRPMNATFPDQAETATGRGRSQGPLSSDRGAARLCAG
jgi:hypothetical protein